MSIAEIKKHLKTPNLVIGTDNTLKALRNNELVKVFLASNASESLAKDIEYYASVLKIAVEKLDIPNDELGTVCKKPFSIACIGMKKVVEKKKY
ncbi:ribosomal L7Ae/L30e/S12e/Gadd45 family protein [Candidatus Woesearchaeota archaeon]|nr:ribosomal L7Ae/L30e/S12e/Gadd45 family protein [Candidatus Woesearchaeota archaeon]